MGLSSSSSFSSFRSPDWSYFHNSGPTHLTAINWEDRTHQRVVASTLINALYVHQEDRREKREVWNARAPRWWDYFGFELADELIDTNDSSPTPQCFGAVFKRKSTTSSPTTESGPAIVVAIRGLKTARDWDVAIKSLFRILDTRTCFRVLMGALERCSERYSPEKIWLCGHSLGATIATGAGQAMAKRGIPLKTFLFNPPYKLDPTAKNLFLADLSEAMAGLMTATLEAGPIGLLAAGAHYAVHHSRKAIMGHISWEVVDVLLYQKMSSWVPFIFVNPGDFLCSDYIKYFDTRQGMPSPSCLPDRIASAVVVSNLDQRASTYPHSHGIRQWWSHVNLRVETKECHVGNAPRDIRH